MPGAGLTPRQRAQDAAGLPQPGGPLAAGGWPAPQDALAHAGWALGVLAVDPAGLGGLRLRGEAGPVRDGLVAELRRLLPPDTPCLRLPLHVDDHRLFGGLDLTATLVAGRPRYQPGLLSAGAAGLVLLPQSSDLPPARAAALAAALDQAQGGADAGGSGPDCGDGRPTHSDEPADGRQRPALAHRPLLLVALDEPSDGGESLLAPVLAERLAIVLQLGPLHLAHAQADAPSGARPLVAMGLAPTHVAKAQGQGFGRDPGASVAGRCTGGPSAWGVPALQLGWPAVRVARSRLPGLACPPALLQAMAQAADALGVVGLRPLLHTLRAARAVSALQGEAEVSPEAMALALRLVMLPLASRLPAPDQDQDQDQDQEQPADTTAAANPDQHNASEPGNPERPPGDDPGASPSADAAMALAASPGPAGAPTPGPDQAEHPLSPAAQQALADQVLQAAVAALPPALLAQLAAVGQAGAVRPGAGVLGAAARSRRAARGRPLGPRRGDPRHGARLHLLATLRAALPWQGLRQPALAAAPAVLAGPGAGPAPPRPTVPAGPPGQHRARLQVRREDFHVWRVRERQSMLTLFVVDASGSAAMHRLAETKGAVELLLADCYVRRDQVALVSFRGMVPASGARVAGAQLLLPPTRALARARACLAALPGGGATPLADGLCMAEELAQEQRRRGLVVNVVVLSDGRANLDRQGRTDRASAMADALAAAGRWPGQGAAVLWLDTAPQPSPQAHRLAMAMGARYLPLPHADARQLARVVRSASPVPG